MPPNAPSDEVPVEGRDDATNAAGHSRSPRRWLSPGGAGVGVASLLSYTGHELGTSLLPTFLRSTVQAGPGLLGVVEGVSDALTGLAKLVGGPLAADPRRRARLGSSGYVGTALATAAIELSTAVWQVGVLRAFAWTSRGLRSPARDTLLAALARSDRYGRAVGMERAGDNLGAVVGPLLAAALAGVLGVRSTILLSVVPGLLAAVGILVAVREARTLLSDGRVRVTLRLNLCGLRRAGIAGMLVPVAAFELGNVATTLLILRATGLLQGTSDGGSVRSAAAATSLAARLYAAHNVVAALAALAAGPLTDGRDPRWALAGGAASATAGFCYAAGWMVLADLVSLGLAQRSRTARALEGAP